MTSFFINTLGPLGWTLLAIVPPAIVALYFLKLRRQPLEVPSTFLWSRTIEDLHVNSLWQKMRQSLLLLLQLLFVLLLILAVLRPGMEGEQKLLGDRFVFLIDNSASMGTKDEESGRTRLDEAKRRVLEMIDQMDSGDVGMVVTFSDRASVTQQFTDNQRVLSAKVAAIQPSEHTTNIMEALRVASGLANPGQSAFEEGDVQVADAKPATAYILSDGRFQTITDFSFGNLQPIYIPLGDEISSNVGILAFSTQRNPEKDDELQVFCRIARFGPEPTEVTANLYFNNELLDVARIVLDSEDGTGGAQFDLGSLDVGKLRLEIEHEDVFPADNVAYAAINPPERAQVLVVSEGNNYLKFALATDQIRRIADVTLVTPDYLTGEDYPKEAASGRYDVIIYDDCAPETMPESNTVFFGQKPPVDGWNFQEAQVLPQIIDVAQSHPVMNFVNLGNVSIYKAAPLEAPAGSTILIESDQGALMSIAPRKSFEDVVLGFAFLTSEDDKTFFNTEWTKRLSFPVFVKNLVEYLGGVRQGQGEFSIRPGENYAFRSGGFAKEVHIQPPSGRTRTIAPTADNLFSFGETDQLGTYEVREGDAKDVSRYFSVNIFDAQESEIQPKPEIETQWETIEGESAWLPMRREYWKWLVVIALLILLLEWYIYNRRVYV
ncbi:BatA and WFA domain-containing protein [Bremerella sp. JC770]|uniref:BatA and WFA domain-containing protein n=1 Tax=Bremerella sp. JC770 TaxID=3232137 RepID=UPI0034598429